MNHRTTRAMLLAVIASMIAIGALAAPTTAAAAAECKQYPSGTRVCSATPADYPSWKGWATVPGTCNWTAFPDGWIGQRPEDLEHRVMCVWGGGQDAWRWNGAGYDAKKVLGGGTQVYVYPFTTGWSWAYASGSWHVMRSSDIRIIWNA